MSQLQEAKGIVRKYFDQLEAATPASVESVLKESMATEYEFYGSYPFLQRRSAEEVAKCLWIPFLNAFTGIQRRQDIFIAGANEFDPQEIWVMSMGHLMGLFDRDWLGIRHTRKMTSLRYAEFSCVKDGKITKTGFFCDILGVMHQAGCYPLPPMTGQYFIYPGPRNHNGLLFEDADPAESEKTLALVNQMIGDITTPAANATSELQDGDLLRRSWAEGMIWYGPCGIGATHTIQRYGEQHQGPFRAGLTDRVFNGHRVRFAEGSFACFFGWPNLTNRNAGGFLGLPEGASGADMQVVDVYSREGDRLSENWVIIDLPRWLKQQGLDVLARTASILNPPEE